MTTTNEEIAKLVLHTEMLSDHELEFLLNIAVECNLIKSGGGIEDLLKAFEDPGVEDDQKAEMYRSLANIAMGVESPKLAGEFLISASNSAKSSEVKRKVSNDTANFQIMMNQFLKAENSIDAAMLSIVTDSDKADILSTKANINVQRNDFEGAISLLGKAAEIYTNEESHKKLSVVQKSVGDAYLEMGDIEPALTSYRESLRYAQKTKGDLPLSPLFFKLGQLNLILNRITPAITYFEDCLKDKSDQLLTVRSLRYLAYCYSSIGGDEEANKLFESSINQALSLEDEKEVALSRDAYTKHLISNGKFDEAKKIIDLNYKMRVDHIAGKGEILPGSWEFAENVYKVYSNYFENVLEEESKKKEDDTDDGSILSGEIVSEVKQLIDMMHHVIDRPKNIAHDYEDLSLKEAVKVFKKEFLTERLAANNWDKNKVSAELGVTLSNLYHHLESLGMNK